MTTPASIERKVRQLDNDVQSIYELLATITGTQARHGNRLDEIDQKVDGLDQKVTGLEQRFDGLEQRFDSLDQKVAGHDQRFDDVDRKLDHIIGLLGSAGDSAD